MSIKNISQIKTWSKKKKILVFGASAVFLIIVLTLLFSGGKKSATNLVTISRGEVVQEVSVTGRVKPAQNVDLAFELSGRVSGIKVDVGSNVYVGQVLTWLESGDTAAQLSGAEATLKSQQAKLAELKNGTRPEEITIQEVKVANAKIAYEDAKKDLIDKIQDAYIKADDAIRNKVDQFFSNPRSSDPKLNFVPGDSVVKLEIESQRLVVEEILVSWKIALDTISLNSDLTAYIASAKNNLSQLTAFLDKAASIVNALTANYSLSQTTIDAYKSSVSTARTNISSAVIALSASEESLSSANSSLLLAENQLLLDKAGVVPEQILAQEANVEKAQADVNNYKAQLSKTVLRSPINGTVSVQNAKIGEIIGANSIVISVISNAKFEMEANVSEADIAKIKIGDTARATLDAYGSEEYFNAIVSKIDPAETMIEGVATYKVTLQFNVDDERIKSGMTANIDVLTQKLSGVIFVPQRSVIAKDGKKFVQISDKSNVVEKEIILGLRGSDGRIEVIEGLKEGDKIVASPE